MKIHLCLGLIVFSFHLFASPAAMTDKQLYVASMENDAKFIESVGDTFMGVANFQRVILEDLSWQDGNSEYEKINKAKESFEKASKNLSVALKNSDKLLKQLSGEKRRKFDSQLKGFKNQVKDLQTRLDKMVTDINEQRLPKASEVHQVISLAVAGTGYGMEVSKKKTQ